MGHKTKPHEASLRVGINLSEFILVQNIHKLGVDDFVALSCRTTMPAKTMQYRLTLHKASLIHIIPSADGHRLQRLIKVDSLYWRQAQHSYTKLLPT